MTMFPLKVITIVGLIWCHICLSNCDNSDNRSLFDLEPDNGASIRNSRTQHFDKDSDDNQLISNDISEPGDDFVVLSNGDRDFRPRGRSQVSATSGRRKNGGEKSSRAGIQSSLFDEEPVSLFDQDDAENASSQFAVTQTEKLATYHGQRDKGKNTQIIINLNHEPRAYLQYGGQKLNDAGQSPLQSDAIQSSNTYGDPSSFEVPLIPNQQNQNLNSYSQRPRYNYKPPSSSPTNLVQDEIPSSYESIQMDFQAPNNYRSPQTSGNLNDFSNPQPPAPPPPPQPPAPPSPPPTIPPQPPTPPPTRPSPPPTARPEGSGYPQYALERSYGVSANNYQSPPAAPPSRSYNAPPAAPPVSYNSPPAAPPVSSYRSPPAAPPVAPPANSYHSPPTAPPAAPPVSSYHSPPAAPPMAPPVNSYHSPPAAPPAAPPVSSYHSPPAAPPAAPPVSSYHSPPAAPPTLPPVAPPAAPPANSYHSPPATPPAAPPVSSYHSPPAAPPAAPPVSSYHSPPAAPPTAPPTLPPAAPPAAPSTAVFTQQNPVVVQAAQPSFQLQSVQQSPQQVVVTQQTPQRVVLAQQAPRQVVLAQQAPQQVVLAQQAPQQVVLAQQAPQRVVLAQQAPQQVVLAQQNPQVVTLSNPSSGGYGHSKVQLSVPLSAPSIVAQAPPSVHYHITQEQPLQNEVVFAEPAPSYGGGYGHKTKIRTLSAPGLGVGTRNYGEGLRFKCFFGCAFAKRNFLGKKK